MNNYSEKFEKMKIAGRLAAQTLDMLTDNIKEGISTNYIDKLGYEFIRDNGGYSAISRPGNNPPDEGVWTTKGNVIYITWSNGYKSQYQYSVFDYDGTPAVKMVIDGKTLYFKKY